MSVVVGRTDELPRDRLEGGAGVPRYFPAPSLSDESMIRLSPPVLSRGDRKLR